MLQLHFSQKPGLAKPCMLLISTVRELLLLDSDHQTLQWLRHFNPVFCKTAAGEAAVLLTKEFGTVRRGRVNNAAMRSRFILDKAGGATRIVPEKREYPAIFCRRLATLSERAMLLCRQEHLRARASSAEVFANRSGKATCARSLRKAPPAHSKCTRKSSATVAARPEAGPATWCREECSSRGHQPRGCF